MAKGKAKQPRHAASPNYDRPAKQPHSRDVPTSGLSWRFSRIDRGGPFAWTALTDPADYKEVMERLHCFETMCDREIGASGSHEIELDRLSKPARDRLQAIEQDDIDSLMSFRITGRRRVFCIRERDVMRILWWDPEHQVCPSIKKHT